MKYFGKDHTKWLRSEAERGAKPCPSNLDLLFYPWKHQAGVVPLVGQLIQGAVQKGPPVYKVSSPSHCPLTYFEEGVTTKLWNPPKHMEEKETNSESQMLLPKAKSSLHCAGGEAKPRDKWG